MTPVGSGRLGFGMEGIIAMQGLKGSHAQPGAGPSANRSVPSRPCMNLSLNSLIKGGYIVDYMHYMQHAQSLHLPLTQPPHDLSF